MRSVRRRIVRSVLPAAGVLAWIAGGAGAQTTVFVRPSAPPGGNGLSWATAVQNLQLGLGLAAANPAVDEVWVVAGTYRPALTDVTATFTVPDGVALRGGFAGTETDPAQRDLAANVTVLDGDLAADDLPGFANRADNALHVVTALDVGSVTLDGLVVRGGIAGQGSGLRLRAGTAELANLVLKENGGTFQSTSGAGAWCDVPILTVRDCVFADNKATGGAGLNLTDTPGFPGWSATFERCTFERNFGTGGAGISIGVIELGFLTVTGCTFRDGHATGGGAISVNTERGVRMVVTDSLFERGDSTSGGGITVNGEQDCEVEIRHSVFRDNRATNGGGVAISCETGGALTVVDSLFERNDGFNGSSIDLRGTVLDVERCRFVADTSPGASGASVWLGTSDNASIRGSLLVGGGHRLVTSYADELALVDSTLVNGGPSPALHVQRGHADVQGSIVWGTAATQITLGPNGTVTARYSDVHMGGAGLPGTGNVDVDPLLVGSLATLALGPGSPCIDAGEPARIVSGVDLGNDSRMLDGDLDGTLVIDMGADERAPVRLDVLGAPVAGGNLRFVTSGAPGLSAVLLLGAPGQRFVPGLGTVFLQTQGALRLPWGTTPSNVLVPVPAGVAGLFHVQLAATGGGARVVTNYVALSF